MRRFVAVLTLLWLSSPAPATGLLIPTEKKLPPLAMLSHQVRVQLEDQVAVTNIEQTFRNHTDRQLEATYIFPVPKGASVRKFSMWVDGKEVPGELVEADKARKIYTDIVQRTLDPGLLEYMGNNLLRLRVFPVPPRGDQKIAISYTSLAQSENGVVEYVYPLRADAKAPTTLEKFTLNVAIKSQHALQNIYSPTHAITMQRPNDKEATVGFELNQATLDKDFVLYYTSSGRDVGLTALTHRPSAGQNGYFMLLISPRFELSKAQQAPRDMVFVLDTSGSMRGKRIVQARNALKYCLSQLSETDRFALLNFGTTVNRYGEGLQAAGAEAVATAKKWVDSLEPSGGTAIDDALSAALALRPNDPSRTFTIVFFTDGCPTIGETDPNKIIQNVVKRNTANTRIFTFGVGDDVNANLLDRLADETRAVCTYVRESEDIEAKVSSLYGKISNPVLTNLKLEVGSDVQLNEVYPPHLPDLFHGSQLTVLGRYTGKGHTAVKLTGTVGADVKEYVYELNFPERTETEKPFVEDLWARRKVGFMLDQIRVNGEKKELVEEIVALAKRYGITTPYTSYLVVPDQPVPIVRRPGPIREPLPAPLPPAVLRMGRGGAELDGQAIRVEDFARQLKADGNRGVGDVRGKLEAERLDREAKALAAALPASATAGEKKAAEETIRAFDKALKEQKAFQQARDELARRNLQGVQEGQLGVVFAVQMNQLRHQDRVTRTASRNVQNRNLIELGGVWIDEAFDPKMPVVSVKAMSDAYFRILERHPKMREVFQLGNWIVWVTPSGTALIIDQGAGREDLSDEEIDRLFLAADKK
ncbi:MAG: VIT domain-containing protein [Gemmataceae bacterium]|nr:VIT domain-containing protein [Gemmataceae bacterium]